MSPSLSFFNQDSRILDLLRKGDEQGLVLLYDQNRALITSFVLHNSGNHDDAEDMIQEALVILWEKVQTGRFEYTAKLSTFLFGTVKNLWSRRLARNRRERKESFEDVDPPDDQVSALDAIIETEHVDQIRRAMEKLGEQCRKILLLFYWEERSMEEIALALGFANAETVKSKKYQCKKSLERLLQTHH